MPHFCKNEKNAGFCGHVLSIGKKAVDCLLGGKTWHGVCYIELSAPGMGRNQTNQTKGKDK
jgi:hypothetical protein